MTSQRVARLREEVKKEASDIIRKLKDPRVGFVTVTDVEVTGDMRHARIYVSILGNPASKDDTMAALANATGFIRTEIGSRIRLRHTPEIQFAFDDSMERGARIFELLRQVDQKSDQGADLESGEKETKTDESP